MDEFKAIFDTLVDRGLLDCYFTGGEIFTRPDFEEIFIYAKKRSIVSLLSNITLLNQRHIDLFQRVSCGSNQYFYVWLFGRII